MTEFSIAPEPNPVPDPLLVASSAVTVTPVFDFLVPIEITFSIPSTGLPAGVRANELRFMQLNGSSWEVVAAQTYDAQARTITASLSSTGTFALIGVAASSIVVTPSADTIGVGGSRQFVAEVTSDDGTSLPDRPRSWSTTNGGIATVINGLVSGVSQGTTRVIGRVESVADTSLITVDSGIQPPQLAPPDIFTNFSTYADSAALMADNSLWAASENLVTVPSFSRMTLDKTMGFGSSDRSMMYQWDDRTTQPGGRCSDIYLTRWIPYRTVVTEVWEEYVVQFSSDFTTKAPAAWSCASNADYKFLLNYTGDASPPQRFDLKHDVYGTGTTWDAGVPGGSDGNAPYIFNYNVLHDGQWHRIRRHMKCNSGSNDGLHVVIIDADTAKVLSGSAIPRTCAQGGISALIVGGNLNQGPDRQMEVHFGQISIWLSNPGAGFK